MSECKPQDDAEHATAGDKSASMQRMISQVIELQRQNAKLQRENAGLKRLLDNALVGGKESDG